MFLVRLTGLLYLHLIVTLLENLSPVVMILKTDAVDDQFKISSSIHAAAASCFLTGLFKHLLSLLS